MLKQWEAGHGENHSMAGARTVGVASIANAVALPDVRGDGH
jgi:hypothetical protein